MSHKGVILRKGQIVPKRLGHITIHDKARHCITSGTLVHWLSGHAYQLALGTLVNVLPNVRARNNGTRQRCPLIIRDLTLDGRINQNRMRAGFALIPTRKKLFARPPSLMHADNIEYPETFHVGFFDYDPLVGKEIMPGANAHYCSIDAR